MDNAVTELLTVAADGISWVLLKNVFIGGIGYLIIRWGKDSLDRVFLYRKIRYGSLGFGSQVYWEGELFLIDDISRQYGNVVLANPEHTRYVGFEKWVATSKMVPTNGTKGLQSRNKSRDTKVDK